MVMLAVGMRAAQAPGWWEGVGGVPGRPQKRWPYVSV